MRAITHGDGSNNGACLDKKVIVRYHAPDTAAVVFALETAGFAVVESVE